MPYIRKTVDEWEVQGNYGQGFETVTGASDRKEARSLLTDYIVSEPEISFRVTKKRVKKNAE